MATNWDQLQNAGSHSRTLDFSKAQEVQAGQRIDFGKENPGVNDVRIELYWDSDHDGDASVLLLDSAHKALKGMTPGATDPNATRGMVWYKNLSVPGVSHSGDVLTSNGDSSAPEETITVKLDQVERAAERVLVVASTYSSGAPVPFGRLRDCKVMVINNDNNQVLYIFQVSEDHSVHTSVELAEFYRRDGEWRYTSMGNGVGKSSQALSDIAQKYGLV